ncbi:uncharacterized protein BO88DRAFT_87186 [Aspergillus vadensis CBS 113365]|uniref:Uncharacterized protein n=1 Tax=Aspergillus vadensis (strain CBS 113365 / IMI 142717 / IBT 24658) TaxID=1448311 RepID=A0A319B278_ASPVC|nr:hypothetical protein BO88DRAFT_87186 [Aspergillus vadensis CBS 113365]PYH66786.1 hypothetical protein BO88DRAFT_87186 [Aspergillus vadensis CBS 113365]
MITMIQNCPDHIMSLDNSPGETCRMLPNVVHMKSKFSFFLLGLFSRILRSLCFFSILFYSIFRFFFSHFPFSIFAFSSSSNGGCKMENGEWIRFSLTSTQDL